MAIQVRRGNEADFDASKMLPGEWAVSLDTKYVRMCFAPGIVLRMATYEGFESDKAQIQAILAECRSIQEVVRRIGNEVREKASLTIEYSNSAKESAERAKIYADNAEAVTGVHIATKDRAGLIKGGDNHIAEDGTLMLITTTDQTTMPNSYDGRLLVEEIGGGESQQNTTSGKNIFGFGESTIDVTDELRPNIGQTLRLESVANEPNKVKCKFAGGNYSSAFIAINGVDGTKDWAISFIVESNTTSYTPVFKKDKTYSTTERLVLLIGGNNGGTAVDSSQYFVLSNIQVEEGTVSTEFEKYTGGIPSPNPSYPQEIKKTVVSEIKTHGKNFFAKDDSTKGYYSPEGVLSSSTVWFIQRLDARNIDKIVMSGITKFGTAVVAETENGILVIGNNGNSVYDVSAYDTIIYSVHKDDFTTSQVEMGEVATPYEPYTESVITLSQPIELYKIGDLQDVIAGNQIKRRLKAFTLGIESWKLSVNGTTYYYSTSDGAIKSGSAIISSHFKRGQWNALGKDEICMGNTQSGVLGISAQSFSSLDELKSFLLNNEVKAVYALAKEVTEDLPIADQIALNSLATYDGITYLEFDSEIEPTFKGEYGTSKVGGYTLEGMLAGRNGELLAKSNSERINALETSVVNNI